MKRSSTLRKSALATQTADRLTSGPNPSSNDSTSEVIPGGAPLDPFQLVESAQASLLVGKEREGLEMLARASVVCWPWRDQGRGTVCVLAWLCCAAGRRCSTGQRVAFACGTASHG